VRKGTAERGVFGRSDVTEWVYRIDLANTLASPLAIEVYDRMPVSRNEQVKVTLAAVTPALAGDAKYIADEKPQGILKWVVTVPAAPEAGKPGTLAIDWTVREEHAQGTLVTPIPD